MPLFSKRNCKLNCRTFGMSTLWGYGTLHWGLLNASELGKDNIDLWWFVYFSLPRKGGGVISSLYVLVKYLGACPAVDRSQLLTPLLRYTRVRRRCGWHKQCRKTSHKLRGRKIGNLRRTEWIISESFAIYALVVESKTSILQPYIFGRTWEVSERKIRNCSSPCRFNFLWLISFPIFCRSFCRILKVFSTCKL